MTDDDNNDNTPREHIAHCTLDQVEQELQLRVQSLEDSRRSWRWTAGIGLPVLLTSIVVVMLWAIDRVSTTSERAGEIKAKIDAQDNLIKLLQQDVVQLRQRAGLNGHPTSDAWALPDKLSLFTPKDPHALVSHP